MLHPHQRNDSGTSTSNATERFNERRRHAHPLNALPSFTSPSLPHPRDPEDDDDFSIEGFGDISLSNAYFIPGKTTGLTPIKRSKPAPSESPRPSLRNNTLAKTSIYDFDNDAGGDGHASDFESSTDTRVALEKLNSRCSAIIHDSPFYFFNSDESRFVDCDQKESSFEELLQAFKSGDRRAAERIIGKESYSHVLPTLKTSSSFCSLPVSSMRSLGRPNLRITRTRTETGSFNSLPNATTAADVRWVDSSWRKPLPPAKTRQKYTFEDEVSSQTSTCELPTSVQVSAPFFAYGPEPDDWNFDNEKTSTMAQFRINSSNGDMSPSACGIPSPSQLRTASTSSKRALRRWDLSSSPYKRNLSAGRMERTTLGGEEGAHVHDTAQK